MKILNLPVGFLAVSAMFGQFSLEAHAQANVAPQCLEVTKAGRGIYNNCDFAVAVQTVRLIGNGYEPSIIVELDVRGSRAVNVPYQSAARIDFDPTVSRESFNYYAGRERYSGGNASTEIQWSPIIRPGNQVGSVQLMLLPVSEILRAKPISDLDGG